MTSSPEGLGVVRAGGAQAGRQQQSARREAAHTGEKFKPRQGSFIQKCTAGLA